EARGKFGRTTLHLAAAEGRTEVCRALTAHGVTPLDLARRQFDLQTTAWLVRRRILQGLSDTSW
ncbi:MAG: hypothetical protein P8018_14165, partial [Acidobacteriota bacterium]